MSGTLKTKVVAVTQFIEISYDESKFTSYFMEEFKQHFYNFDTIDQHLCHLAQLEARGMVALPSSFIEGYGELDKFGVSMNLESQEENVQ